MRGNRTTSGAGCFRARQGVRQQRLSRIEHPADRPWSRTDQALIGRVLRERQRIGSDGVQALLDEARALRERPRTLYQRVYQAVRR